MGELDSRPDDEGRGEGRREAAHPGIGLDRVVLPDHLLLDVHQPLRRCDVAGEPKRRPAQIERVINGRQRFEELDAAGEGTDLEAERQRHLRVHRDEHVQRAELGKAEAQMQPHAGHLEPAINADEEHAVGHRGRAVERVNERPVRIELQDAADQRGLQLAAKHHALHAHAQRGDVDDREFALEEQRRLDLHAFDRAGEFQPFRALDSLDARREREHEVLGVILDVRPLDADRVDLDRQPRRPFEAIAGRRPDGEEHAEARLGLEAAVTEEREVPRLTAQFHAADLHLRPERREGHDLLAVRRARVEHEVPRRQGEEVAELDLQRVHLEQEGVHLALAERQLRTQRLGVRGAVRVDVIGRLPIRDRRGDGPAGEEFRSAGGKVDRPVEHQRGLGVEVDLEIRHPDPDVIKLQNSADANLAIATRLGGLRHGRSGPAGLGRRSHAAVLELSLTERESVHAHDQPRHQRVVRIVRLRIELRDAPANVERRNRDAGRLDADQLLAAVDRLVDYLRLGILAGARIVFDQNAGRFNRHHVWHHHAQAGDTEAEFARHIHADVAAQQAKHIDADVERAQHARQFRRDSAALLLLRLRRARLGARAAKREGCPIDPDGDGEIEQAILEREILDSNRRPLQRQRAERQGVRGRSRAGGIRGDGELLHARRVARRQLRDHPGHRLAQRGERVGAEVDLDLAILEQVHGVARVFVLQVIPVGGARDEHRRADQLGSAVLEQRNVRQAGPAQGELIARDEGDIDGVAVLGLERDIDVAAGVEAGGSHRRPAFRIGQRRRRSGLGQHALQILGGGGEVLHRAEVVRPARVGPGVGQELERDVAVFGEGSGERVTVSVGTNLGRRVEGDARNQQAVHAHHKLSRRVEDARLVQADTVRIRELHVDGAGRVQLDAVHHLAGERLRNVGRREEHLRLGADRRADAEDGESVQPEAIETEAAAAPDAEADVATQAEGFLAVRLDLHEGTGNRHRDLAAGPFGERDRAANLNHVRDLDGNSARETGDFLRRREVDDHGTGRAGRARDGERARDHLARGVDVHRGAAGHGEAVESDQRDVALGVQRVFAAILVDETDLRVGERHAGGRRVAHALGQLIRAFAEEDRDAVTREGAVRADADITVQRDEVADLDFQILGEDGDHRRGRQPDDNVASVQRDGLVHRHARGVDGDPHRRVQREARHRGPNLPADDAGDSRARED